MPKRSNTFQRVVSIVQKHMAGDATVEESAMIPQISDGRPREVDAVITGSVAGHMVRVGVEAAKSGRRATAEWVERMIGKHANLALDRLVLYSASGFTAGARSQATAKNVTLIEEKQIANEKEVEDQILAGLVAICPRSITVAPRSVRLFARRADGYADWFSTTPDDPLFVEDGASIGAVLGEAVRDVVHDMMIGMSREIGMQDVSGERDVSIIFTLKFGSDVELQQVWIMLRDSDEQELYRIEKVDLNARIKIRAERVEVVHARLGDVNVAYGETTREGTVDGVVVASSFSGQGTVTMDIDGTESTWPLDSRSDASMHRLWVRRETV